MLTLNFDKILEFRQAPAATHELEVEKIAKTAQACIKIVGDYKSIYSLKDSYYVNVNHTYTLS